MENEKLLRIKQLNNTIIACTKCELYKKRINAVTGYGNINSKLMLIGEAPGKNEDIQGKPFVGSAGKILDELLKRINLSREEIYITNVVKCRPPNNRTPLKEEIITCIPYLKQEIEIIKPDLILTLGRISGQAISIIFNYEFEGIEKERKDIREVKFDDKKIKIIATYHPAAALYKPDVRHLLEIDFDRLNDLINNTKNKKHKNLLDYF